MPRRRQTRTSSTSPRARSGRSARTEECRRPDAQHGRGSSQCRNVVVALMQRRAQLRIGMPRVLNMYVYAPFFSGYFEASACRRESRLLRLHQRRVVPRGRRPRRDRPVLPGQDRHRARPQPALREAREEEARSHLLPDGRHAAHAPVAPAGLERVSHRDGHAGHGEGGVHQRRRTFLPSTASTYLDPILNFANRRLLCQQMFRRVRAVLGLSPEENARAVDVGYRGAGCLRVGHPPARPRGHSTSSSATTGSASSAGAAVPPRSGAESRDSG